MIDYDTAEYRLSNAATAAQAISAYEAGADGSGVTVAVIDSGIDIDNPEFSGRIHSASRDIAGTRGIDDSDGHGTSTAAVLAAARNDRDIHGLAFGATILALRTDTPGSCEGSEGCQHDDNNLATAIDVATDHGARVINLSLGGGAVNSRFRTAIADATARGVVVVIAAGNDSLADPDAFAMVATDQSAARGLVLVAGATDAAGAMASYSNRAGIAAEHYIATLGDQVRAFDHTGAPFLFSGTSYATPGVAAAAALLFDAFPNLTPAQVVDLLLHSTDDAGATGVDAVFGRGILNLSRAFQPQGAASVAGSALALSTLGTSETGSTLGASTRLAAALTDIAIIDGYGRAFTADLSASLRPAAPRRWLENALRFDMRRFVAGDSVARIAMQLTDAIPDRPLSAHDTGAGFLSATGVVQPSARLRLGFATGNSDGLAGQLDLGAQDAPLLAAQRAGLSRAAVTRDARAMGIAWQQGRWTLGAIASSESIDHGRGRRDGRLTQVRFAAARHFGPLRFVGQVALADEDNGMFGGNGAGLLAVAGATHRLLGLETAVDLGAGWQLSGQWTGGWTRITPGAGLLAGIDGLTSSGWRVAADKTGLFTPGDRFTLGLAQPLRISRGMARLSVPTGYDYVTRQAVVSQRGVALAPDGREIDLEAGYGLALPWGQLDANFVWRRDPGHIADSHDDLAAALRWSSRF